MAKQSNPPQPTNGPYGWGNGPKPQGTIARIIKAITKKKGN